MPELPEVEVTRQGLLKTVLGQSITKVQANDQLVLKNCSKIQFSRRLKGQSIIKIERFGKFLIFQLSSGDFLLSHFRMTGQMIYGDKDPKSRVLFQLSDGKFLNYKDSRRFGELWIVKDWKTHPGIAKLGADPVLKTESETQFIERLKKKNKAIKPLLLEQDFLAGLGNIYAQEVLFRAKIHPLKTAKEISTQKARVLFREIHTILKEAIALGGSSIKDYVNISGVYGTFQLTYKVYGRKDQACHSCKKTLETQSIGGRTTVFCPRCQK